MNTFKIVATGAAAYFVYTMYSGVAALIPNTPYVAPTAAEIALKKDKEAERYNAMAISQKRAIEMNAFCETYRKFGKQSVECMVLGQ